MNYSNPLSGVQQQPTREMLEARIRGLETALRRAVLVAASAQGQGVDEAARTAAFDEIAELDSVLEADA